MVMLPKRRPGVCATRLRDGERFPGVERRDNSPIPNAPLAEPGRRPGGSALLCGAVGSPESTARTVLSAAAGGVLRGAELGAGHRLAGVGFGERASLSGIRPGGGAAESFDLVADATAGRRGDARRGVHLGAEAVGGSGTGVRGRRSGSMRRRWRRTRRCGASCAGTRGKTMRRS